MSIVHDQPEEQGRPQPPSPQPAPGQPGAGSPGGPGYPPGTDGWYGAGGGYGLGGYPAGGYGAGGYGPGGYGPGSPTGSYGGYGGYATGGGSGGPGQPGQPGGRRRRHLLAGALAAVLAFAAGAGGTAWAVGGSAGAQSVLSTASIVRMNDPAVVNVVSTLGDQGAESAGTGIVLSSSGEVLTNNHVIDGATSIRVTDVGNGQEYRASVVGYDATHDIAVLKLSGASGLKTAKIGDSSAVRTGQKVVALGNAGGRGGTPSVAQGHVTGLGKAITAVDKGSGTSERLTGVIRTNADIQAGDSGGPLLNTAGQVIGVNTAASTADERTSTGAIQAFAIPISRAVAIASKIESGTATSTIHIGATAFLGVGVSTQGSALGGAAPGNTGSGAAIAQILPGGAAAGAGLQAGDVIVSLGGRSVTSPNGLRNALVAHHPGDTVSVTWVDQSGQQQSASVVLGNGPAA